MILFGSFKTPDNTGNINHAVLCYGIKEETFTGTGYTSTNRYFVVNYGWPTYTNVYLLDSLFVNPVGSAYYMEPRV